VTLDDGWGLLRSVAVDPARRSEGLGSLAVAAAAARARDAGFHSLALFTESAEAFFTELGFRQTARADLPRAVTGTRQAADCPSATAMTREIAAD
jgi:amino-acid N-acetyltransferase